MRRPVVGITLDNVDNAHASGRYEVGTGYADCVAAVGGLPLCLPHDPALARLYLQQVDAVVLTGGVDPDTSEFGVPSHPQARLMDPRRQAFELALLGEAEQTPELPVLGVCLGMQLMVLRAGGTLSQHMPSTHAPEVVARHSRAWHTVGRCVRTEIFPEGNYAVYSNHQQVISDAGQMRVTVRATDDKLIEGVDDPSRPFYVGVQWHPERSADDAFGKGLFRALVDAANSRMNVNV